MWGSSPVQLQLSCPPITGNEEQGDLDIVKMISWSLRFECPHTNMV